MITANRVQASVRACTGARPSGPGWCSCGFWVLVALAGVGLPWVALWGSTRLRSWIASFLVTDSTEVFGTRSGVAALIVIHDSHLGRRTLCSWPGPWPQIIVEQQLLDQEFVFAGQRAMERPGAVGLVICTGSCYVHQGWNAALLGGLNPEVGKALQQTVTVGSLATLVFLVATHALVHAPGGPDGQWWGVWRWPGCALLPSRLCSWDWCSLWVAVGVG